MKNLILLVCAAVIALAGCSTQQNPFDGNVVGVDPDEGRKKPTPDPLFSDSLRLDSSSPELNFQEGTESTFTLSARSLIPATDALLQIENLLDFPGLKFDTKTLEIKWTPGLGFAGSDLQRRALLKVSYSVFSTEAQIRIQITKVFPVVVLKKLQQPQVVRVTDLVSQPIREGTLRQFEVVVDDQDSMTGKVPRLLITTNTSSSYPTAATLVDFTTSQPVQDSTNKARWTFRMQVDAREKELTRDEDQYEFAFIALSSFGIQSNLFPVNVKFRTDVKSPVFTFDNNDQVSVVATERNRLSFSVYDPSAEGKIVVSAGTLAVIPGQHDVTCLMSGGNFQVKCDVLLQPDLRAIGQTYTWTVRATNQSPVQGDSAANKQVVQTMFIKVEAPPPPPPTTTTSTTIAPQGGLQ
ncbi:MAG: hypothetical protein ACK5P6_05370 [Pseudobdellovibrionaceae bacterium]